MTKSIFILFLIAVLMNGCGTTDDTAVNTNLDGAEAASNIAESAMSIAGAESTASEGASTPYAQPLSENFDHLSSADFVNPDDDLHPLAACTFSTSRTVCSTNSDTLTWNACSVGTATLTGIWNETWSAGFCANGALPGALTTGASVTRTSTGQTLTLPSKAVLYSNTTQHAAYDGTTVPGTGITTTKGASNRTITINGMHRTFKGPYGRSWFDHSIMSTSLTVAGTRAGQDRVITGTMTMYHNLLKYKAVHTFNGVTWGSNSCCYPTSGTITSVLTGSLTGNTTLTFNNVCGQASFTDTSANVTAVTLSQCN